jgi:membrane protease YdiL (CAAX protease family)
MHDATGSLSTPPFWRRFLPLWLLGAVGVASLLLQPLPATLPNELRGRPIGELRALLLLNPLLLMTAFTAAGAAVAHRAGLASRVAGTAARVGGLGSAFAWGLLVAVLLTVADEALAPLLGAAWEAFLREQQQVPWLPALALGVLYGGITEELMMRWGLMALVAWFLQRLLRGRRPAWIFIVAIFVAATVFALGHLPALAQQIEVPAPIAARTVALNLLPGLLFGALFWRRGLEAAMLAHAATHVGFALLRPLA